jgi:hypothetical protein
MEVKYFKVKHKVLKSSLHARFSFSLSCFTIISSSKNIIHAVNFRIIQQQITKNHFLWQVPTYSKKYLPHIIKIIGRWLSTDKSNLLINYYLYVLISKNQINHHFHMHECVVVFFFFFSHLNHVCIKMAGKIKINSSDVLQKSNRMKDLKKKKTSFHSSISYSYTAYDGDI